VSRQAETTAAEVDRKARRSRTLSWAVRSGLVAYGLMHLLVAWVALELEFGRSSEPATGKGALAQLADGAGGRTVLLAMAVGFGVLAAWQVLAAAVGYRDRGGWRRAAERFAAACRVVTYGYLGVAAVSVVLDGHAASRGSSPDSTTARVMAAPAGTFLLLGVGLTAAGIGIGLAVFGLRSAFLGQLDRRARKADRRLPIVVLGQVGYVVKGAAFVVIGILLCWAAATHDPNKSGGLDQALRELLGATLGGPAIVITGLGIGCFGLYLFARSWHLNEDSLTS
jgi:hypothetical protein